MNPKLLDAVERAGWTLAQTFFGTYTAADIAGLHLLDWRTTLVAAVIAGGTSLLKSLGINVSSFVPGASKPVTLESFQVSQDHPYVTNTDSK